MYFYIITISYICHIIIKLGFVMQNWDKIKQEITLNIGKEFSSAIQPCYNDFNHGLDLFYKVVSVRCNNSALDGLTRTVLPAIYDAFGSHKGELNPVKILAEELEPFFKKICLLLFNKDYTNNHSKSLGPLMEELNLSTVISNRGGTKFQDLFSAQNIITYKNGDGYIEYLANSYNIRNEVHNSPIWTYIEVFQNLKSLLIAYIYPVLKYKSELDSSISTLFIDINPLTNNALSYHEKALYEFISLGNNTVELKKQILKSSILYYIFEKQNPNIEDIYIFCNTKHKLQANPSIYKSIITSLITDNRLRYYNPDRKEVELIASEKERIKNAIDNFEFQENNFNLAVSQCLQKFSIESEITNIIERLKKLLESNYNSDIYEIFNQAYSSNNNNEQCHLFISYLESVIQDNDKRNELFFDLLLICQENDFLHKMSASYVLSKYIDSTQMQNYLRQQKRIVYLDSQILFYAICYYYSENVKGYSNAFYNTVRDLLKYSEQNENIELRTTLYYVNETAYHLKEALLLIPFEELGFFDAHNSQNVFFRFYKFLRDEQLLEEDVNSFADFLGSLDFEYEDVFNADFMAFGTRIISEYLNILGIKVEAIKKCTQGSVSYDIFKNTLNILGKPRQEITIENDASMLNLLSDHHDVNDLFFASWDTAFYDARKRYIENIKASRHFYLYSPAKLLTNFSLANFEVNPSSVTLEFQSILDAENIQSKTSSMLDIISNFFDIGKDERRKYISKLKEFKTKYLIDIDSRPEETHGEEREHPYIILIKDLTYNFNRKNKYSLDDLKSLFNNDEYFENITTLFKSELDFYQSNLKFTGKLTSELHKLIDSQQQYT